MFPLVCRVLDMIQYSLIFIFFYTNTMTDDVLDMIPKNMRKIYFHC